MTPQELGSLLPTVVHPHETLMFRELSDDEISRLWVFLAVGYMQLRDEDVPTRADHVTIFWETGLEMDRREH